MTVTHDLARVAVGIAEDPAGPTGTTVVEIAGGGRTAVDRRGGAIGVSGGFPFSHAVVLTGGSSFGFAAGAGVADELLRRSGDDTGFATLPAVNTAVIYDFDLRDNAVYPTAELGRDALRAVHPGVVPVGRVGAGVSAAVGKIGGGRCERGGQGAAFGRFGGVGILVVTVVNAVGVVVDRSGEVVRGNVDPATGRRRHPAAALTADLTGTAVGAGNTTITALVTDVRLGDRDLAQLARQVHSSMHRAVQPFHTASDGDVLFAVTTDEVDAPATAGSISTVLGTVASELAWDAVLSAVS